MRLVIYGAVAIPPQLGGMSGAHLWHRLREHMHIWSDVCRISLSDFGSLNYKRYESPNSFNVGDVAISMAVHKLLEKVSFPAQRMQYCNWGDLDKIGLNKNDFVVVAGSGYFHLSADNSLAPRIFDDFAVLEKSGAKVAMLGVGVNRPSEFNDDEVRFKPGDLAVMRRLLNHSGLTSVRDRFSASALNQVAPKPVARIGDPALHLASLLDIHHCAQPNARLRIGVNFSFHGPTSTAILNKNLAGYIEALRSLQDKYHCDFFYLTHYNTENLIPKLLRSKGIQISTVAGGPDLLLKTYATLDLHIGGMLHSCILAHSVDVPCIGLAYDIKHFGFFDLLGVKHLCLSAYDFKAHLLVNLVAEALGDSVVIREALRKRRLTLYDESLAFARKCADACPSLS
jgi:polysaccharide pyruvyl transferase WcaK-like protein